MSSDITLVGSDGLPLIGASANNLPTPIGVDGAEYNSRSVNTDSIQNLGLTNNPTSTSSTTSATYFQSKVSGDIQSFIFALIEMAQGDTLIAQLIDTTLGVAQLPSISTIDSQWQSDNTLLTNAQTEIDNYNNYLSSLQAAGQSVNDTDGPDITSAKTSIDTAASQLTTDIQSLQTYLNNPPDLSKTDNQQIYADTVNDYLSDISSDYSNVQNAYSNFSTAASNYQQDVSTFNGIVKSPGVASSDWTAAQNAITLRNQAETLVGFYGKVQTLQNFPGTYSKTLTTVAVGTSPTSITFPTVDASQLGSSSYVSTLLSTINGIIGTTDVTGTVNTGTTNAKSQVDTAATTVGTNKTLVNGVTGTQLTSLTIPTQSDYESAVLTNLYKSISSEALSELMLLLGLQNSASANELEQLFKDFTTAAPVSLNNPSGAAVTGATASTSNLSQIIQAFEQKLANQNTAKASLGLVYQTGNAIKGPLSAQSDPTATPVGITTASDALTSATPGSTNQTGISANITTLATDFLSLLGQFSVLAAGVVLKNGQALEQQSQQTLQEELLAATLAITSNVSPDQLQGRLQSILTTLNAGQNLSADQQAAQVADATALYNTFLGAVRGNIANTLSQNSNFAVSAIGAQIAGSYVQTTQAESARTDAQQTVLLQNEQVSNTNQKALLQNGQVSNTNQTVLLQNQAQSQQNIQTLVANLPSAAYLTQPSDLAQNSPNSPLGAALAANLPQDSQGNYPPVSPQTLYAALVAGLGPDQATAPFLHFVQNDPDYKLSVANASAQNQAKGVEFDQKHQDRLQSVLADYANQAVNIQTTQNANQQNQDQLSQVATQGLDVAQQINNPSLATFYHHHSLPGQNVLNKGTQLVTDQALNTPSVRATTVFPV